MSPSPTTITPLGTPADMLSEQTRYGLGSMIPASKSPIVLSRLATAIRGPDAVGRSRAPRVHESGSTVDEWAQTGGRCDRYAIHVGDYRLAQPLHLGIGIGPGVDADPPLIRQDALVACVCHAPCP